MPRRFRFLFAFVLFVALGVTAVGPPSRFKPPDPSRPLVFPRDHGSHDDARIEWWYVTGHLVSPSGGRFGYQLTFFRSGLLDEPRPAGGSAWAARDFHLAHFARTDVGAGTFRYAERIHRTGPGAALASEDHLRAENEDWRLEELGGRFVLHARDGADELSLLLTPEKPMALHGENGLSRKGEEPEAVSRYVSFTRLKTEGWWTAGGAALAVTGFSWLDHEWGSGSIGKETAGWDWLAIQLADGRDLMLYRMRSKGGGPSRFSAGTLVGRDGRATPLGAADFSIAESGRFTSPKSAASYPNRWVVEVPKAGLAVEVVPYVADQELVTERSTKVTYWEGDCAVRAPGSGSPLGEAYVEMTGYAGTGALGAFR